MAGSARLKDHWAEQRLFAGRLLAAVVVILLLVTALAARLYYLQVVRHDYFSELSQGNRIPQGDIKWTLVKPWQWLLFLLTSPLHHDINPKQFTDRLIQRG